MSTGNLESLADPSVRPSIQLAIASALRHSGENKDAKRMLDSLQSPTPEIEAERLFNLGEIARDSNDEDGFLRILGQLRQAGPTSPWLEQALLSAGNIYLLKPDYDHAIDYYRELQQRFPNAARASYAHWKVAWLSFRQGRTAEAKDMFEQQIALYPSSGEVPAALYWRARLAEEDGEPAKARAYYQKLGDRFHNYYYGYLARERLAKLKADSDPVHYALLDHIPPLDFSGKVEESDIPSDDLRVQKAELLENGGLLDFALRELQAAAKDAARQLASRRERSPLSGRGSLRLGGRIHEACRPELFCGGFAQLAARLLGGAVSQTVLG